MRKYNTHRKKVSYGQTEDEYVEIESLTDEIRFQVCIKLYKQCTTVEELEFILGPKMFKHLNNSK